MPNIYDKGFVAILKNTFNKTNRTSLQIVLQQTRNLYVKNYVDFTDSSYSNGKFSWLHDLKKSLFYAFIPAAEYRLFTGKGDIDESKINFQTPKEAVYQILTSTDATLNRTIKSKEEECFSLKFLFLKALLDGRLGIAGHVDLKYLDTMFIVQNAKEAQDVLGLAAKVLAEELNIHQLSIKSKGKV